MAAMRCCAAVRRPVSMLAWLPASACPPRQCRDEHMPGRSIDLSVVDLRRAGRAILEQDRDLRDPKARVGDAVQHLFKERVAGRTDRKGVHRFEDPTRVYPEAGGAVAH